MARIKDASVEAVKAATDIVTLVEGYTRLRKSGSRYIGLCPFHQERTPSFGVSPDRGTFKCFGCGEGGDAITFVEKQENLDFVGAIEWLADRFGVQLEYEETSPGAGSPAQAARAALPAARPRGRRSTSATSGSPRAALSRATTSPPAACGEEVCREFRLGLAPGGAALARAAAGQGFTSDELARRRARQPPRQRLLLAPADVPARRRARARARVPGAAAVRGRPAAREVRQLARGRPLPEGRPPLRARPRARGDREAGPRRDRRGQPRRDRAAAGRLRAGGRRDGDGPHRGAPARAPPADQATSALCFDADAAGQEATLRGMELAAGQGFDIRVVSLPSRAPIRPTTRPRSKGASRPPRNTCPTACASRSSGIPDRQRAFERVREILAPYRDSPERQDAVRLAADRLGLPVSCRRPRAGGARRGRRGLAEGARGRRPPGARRARRASSPTRPSTRCSPS